MRDVSGTPWTQPNKSEATHKFFSVCRLVALQHLPETYMAFTSDHSKIKIAIIPLSNGKLIHQALSGQSDKVLPHRENELTQMRPQQWIMWNLTSKHEKLNSKHVTVTVAADLSMKCLRTQNFSALILARRTRRSSGPSSLGARSKNMELTPNSNNVNLNDYHDLTLNKLKCETKLDRSKAALFQSENQQDQTRPNQWRISSRRPRKPLCLQPCWNRYRKFSRPQTETKRATCHQLLQLWTRQPCHSPTP